MGAAPHSGRAEVVIRAAAALAALAAALLSIYLIYLYLSEPGSATGPEIPPIGMVLTGGYLAGAACLLSGALLWYGSRALLLRAGGFMVLTILSLLAMLSWAISPLVLFLMLPLLIVSVFSLSNYERDAGGAARSVS